MAIFIQKHADKILELMQVGFFDMRSGSITVHVDALGKTRKIEKHSVFNVV